MWNDRGTTRNGANTKQLALQTKITTIDNRIFKTGEI